MENVSYLPCVGWKVKVLLVWLTGGRMALFVSVYQPKQTIKYCTLHCSRRLRIVLYQVTKAVNEEKLMGEYVAHAPALGLQGGPKI